MIKRIIPSSGEALPVIGLGTWQTFDVTGNAYPGLKEVLTKMHTAGGTLIDSSPMYGRSENAIGDICSAMPAADDFFYATKVWTTGLQQGIEQMESSMQKMQRTRMDLMQIHNLTDWKTHLPQLRRWKESGKIRYIGITHYTDASHEELEKIITAEKLDFVQFNYSITARNAEKRLLNVAAANGVATLINRPFGEGKLFGAVNGKPLPAWAKEIGIESWAAFFLKYIIAHPAVTCVIPATGNPAHVMDNLKAGEGILPDDGTRKKLIDWLANV
ncbi:aldo/keto reductase [Ferruginibacter sp. SUN106]|uniref:aldo/keto reductase n=1 Tax=Ferruginibacter sp. SUN106 TaxID=2978348 RepID=UPI003D367BE5